MGINSGISTKWLFIHCFQIELEFRSVDFCDGWKTGELIEKPYEQGWEPTTNSTHIWCQGWEASILTTAPSLLPHYLEKYQVFYLFARVCTLIYFFSSTFTSLQLKNYMQLFFNFLGQTAQSHLFVDLHFSFWECLLYLLCFLQSPPRKLVRLHVLFTCMVH